MENSSNATTATAAQEFILSRTLDAPRELVFKAWTQAEHLKQWWGAKGTTLQIAALDVHPGGVFHYGMHLPGGGIMWGRFVYQEIEEPERLVYVSSFADEAGNVIRAPFSETWPLETYNTITLEDEDGKTVLTLKSSPLNATVDERKTYTESFGSLEQGFTGTLSILEAYLAKQKV